MNTKLLNTVVHQDMRDVLGNMTLGKAAIAVGSAGATYDVGAAFSYMIEHVLYSLAAGTNKAIAAGDVQAISTDCMYLCVIDAAGTPIVVQGTPVATGEGAYLPEVPDGYVPFGAFKITTDATHTYTPGTTLNSATGITDTYYNLPRWTPAAF